MRSLRVAAHNGALAWGGGEKWVTLLLRGLRERGHEVQLFCNDAGVAARAREEGVDAQVAVLGGQAMLSDAWRFSRRLRALRPDALLLSTIKKTWLGGMAGRWAGVTRTVARIGLDTDLPGKHWTYRVAFTRWVDAVLVNADGIRRGVLSGMPDLDPSRVATVYDGVRLSGSDSAELLLPAAFRARHAARLALGLPSDVPVVGSLARFAAQKRLDRFLDALALLPGVHGVLAGEGELEGDLRTRARALGLEDRIHFLGWRRDVEAVLAALDVFVLTSDREGMANAMLEAMASGVPVVSTPVSGADEALDADARGRAAGLVVDAEPCALADAVSGLLGSAEARAAMGAEGQRRVRERFSREAMLDAWEGVRGGDPPARWHRGGRRVA
ncbi:MAG: glycosyltransferase [Gemmatimonadetes bacterium]|nr:glycosyltransferase [Gemmatimonadota bacterium]